MTRSFLFVCTQLELGGVQVKAVNLAKSLRGRGHDAQVWFLYRKRPCSSAVEQTRCLLDRKPLTPIDYLTILTRLSRLIKEQNPDIVLGMGHYASPLACGCALAHGIKSRIATQCGLRDTFPPLAQALDWLAGTLGVYTCNAPLHSR